MLEPTQTVTKAAVMLLALAIADDAPITLDLPGRLELTVRPDTDVTYLTAFFTLMSAGANA